ncbi:MAG: UvrD-helicase domain-containing protein [Clostridia bacterium]
MSGAQVPVDWTQREQVRTDFAHNLVVEAGAGTGKTTLLVERTLFGLASGQLTLPRLAVVTYLEKAAVELRQRIRSRIAQALDTESDPLVRQRLQRAVVDLPEARIGTLHGLGHGILVRHAIELGLDPRMTVWDAVETERQRESALRAWLREPHPEVVDALRLGVRFGDIRLLLETVLDLPGDHTAWGPAPEAVDQLVEGFLTVLEHLQMVIDTEQPDPEDRGVRQVVEWRETFSRLASMPASMRVARLYSLKLGAPAGRQANWGGARARLGEQKAVLSALRERLETWQAALAGTTGKRLVASGEAFAAYFRAWRLERRAVIFDDQVDLVREALQDRDIRDMEAGSLDAILVDEYQDTSAAQAAIVRALAAGPGRRAADLPPAGRLVLVGDPKQSIYGFNGADLIQARQWSEGLVRDGAAVLVPITVNFRSRPQILERVNETFAAVFATEPDRDPAYRPLVPHRTDGPAPAVRRYRLYEEGEDLASDAARSREAAAIAALIGRAVHDGWPVAAPQGTRRLQFRDVTILVPRRTGLDLYRRALEEAGIPVLGGSGRDFYRRDEVRGLAAVLRAVVLPDDRLAVMAALRSPFFGVEDRLLMRHTLNGGGLSVDEPGDPANPVAVALARLGGWSRTWTGRPLAVLLEEVAAPLWEEMDGRERANVDALIAECARYAERWGGAEYVEWLWTRIRAGDEGDEPVPAGAADAVQFSTIHRAKGLEWPMVVVANLRHERPPRQDVVLYDRAHQRWGLKIGPKKTAAFDDVAEELRAEGEAEARRLWYVALTRARDHLIVMETDPAMPLFQHLVAEAEPWAAMPARVPSGSPHSTGARRAGLGLSIPESPLHPGGEAGADGDHLQFGRLFHVWAARMFSEPRARRDAVVSRAPDGVQDALRWLARRPWVPEAPARTEVSVHALGPPPIDGVIDVLIEDSRGFWVVELKTARTGADVLPASYRTQIRLYLAALADVGVRVQGGVVSAPFDRREWRVNNLGQDAD